MFEAILCLSIYATICMVIIIALSFVTAQGLSCKMVTEALGMDNKVKTSAKYDILSVDLSRSKDASDQCDIWSSLGMEFFEFFILGILTIFLAYKTVKKICGKEGILLKRRDAKLQRDPRKLKSSKFGSSDRRNQSRC